MNTLDGDERSEGGTRARLRRSQSTWLKVETAKWVDAGIIGTDARTRILASYDLDSGERHGLLALMLLGALMFGIGVLLLIGYNWSLIPVNGKVALIMGSVALGFGM